MIQQSLSIVSIWENISYSEKFEDLNDSSIYDDNLYESIDSI